MNAITHFETVPEVCIPPTVDGNPTLFLDLQGTLSGGLQRLLEWRFNLFLLLDEHPELQIILIGDFTSESGGENLAIYMPRGYAERFKGTISPSVYDLPAAIDSRRRELDISRYVVVSTTSRGYPDRMPNHVLLPHITPLSLRNIEALRASIDQMMQLIP